MKVYLGLGSNFGDRLENIRGGINAVGSLPGVTVSRVSSIYETAPVDCEGGNFYNVVLELDCEWDPFRLLEETLLIEKRFGKVGIQKNKARSLDIDILLWGSEWIENPNLTIPHPRMHERRFVLEPLYALNQELIHPVLKKSVADILGTLPEGGILRKISL